MINNSFVKNIEDLNTLISELEETFGSIRIETVLTVRSGYMLYYSFPHSSANLKTTEGNE